MANGLMGLQDLLGQSSNAQSGGLLGGGIFSQPEGRGQRRSRLLSEAIAGAGQDPYARLGATFGGLIGMGGRAAGEGLGILDEPPEVKRNNAIRQVQQEVAERGLDPMANPAEFGEFVSSRFQELEQPELAMRTQLQIRQMMPEQEERRVTLRGGTEEAEQFAQRTGYTVPEGQTFALGLKGDSVTSEENITPEQDANFVPLTAEEKQQIGLPVDTFAQRNTRTDRIHTAGGQTIEVGGEADPAIDALGDQFKGDLERASEAATQATGLLEEVNRATDLLSQPDFNTGAARPLINQFRAIADDLGVSLDPALEEAGVENIGQISDAQSFAAFSANLTTRLAERLPGNLNQQEINLITRASSDLGKTPEANAEALAAFRAGSELAQQRANDLTEAASGGTEAFIAEQRRQRETGTERFERLSERYRKEILESRRGEQQDELDLSSPQQLSNERLRSLVDRDDLTSEQLEILADEWDRRGL